MPTSTTKRATKAVEPKPATTRTRKPKAGPVPAPATEHGPRGEVRSRHGVELDGALAGYVIALAFKEFEVARHTQHGWVTVRMAHITSHPAATKAEATLT